MRKLTLHYRCRCHQRPGAGQVLPLASPLTGSLASGAGSRIGRRLGAKSTRLALPSAERAGITATSVGIAIVALATTTTTMMTMIGYGDTLATAGIPMGMGTPHLSLGLVLEITTVVTGVTTTIGRSGRTGGCRRPPGLFSGAQIFQAR